MLLRKEKSRFFLFSNKKTATWLILPVVICLSQRLSHASLSTVVCKNYKKPRMAHYISNNLFDGKYSRISVVILELIRMFQVSIADLHQLSFWITTYLLATRNRSLILMEATPSLWVCCGIIVTLQFASQEQCRILFDFALCVWKAIRWPGLFNSYLQNVSFHCKMSPSIEILVFCPESYPLALFVWLIIVKCIIPLQNESFHWNSWKT